MTFSRRSLLQLASAAVPLNLLSRLPLAQVTAGSAPMPIMDNFPSHPPEMVRELVLVSHYDLKRVRELVEARPTLAGAAWDWGFGDWENALGARRIWATDPSQNI